MGTLKDSIRQRGLDGRNVKERAVEVEMDGVPTKVLIRQPSMKVRRILAEVGGLDKEHTNTAAITAMKVEALILCCVDDDGTPVFDAGDRPKLEAQAANGWVDFLAARILEFMRGTTNPTCAEKGVDGKVCGSELPVNASFCPRCGRKQPDSAEIALGNSVTTLAGNS